jgi:ADP-ribose pyrophosphatase YjhB (NUDIX family)
MLEEMGAGSSDFREPHLRHDDFLGSFAVLETDRGILMVENRRRIGGREVAVFDLPGGQVEPGELLRETLRRELREEAGIEVDGDPEFLFVQEGEKVEAGVRRYAWRSFFFAVRQWRGEPRAGGEVESLRFVPRRDLPGLLVAPYHDSFAHWLRAGGTCFLSTWRE